MNWIRIDNQTPKKSDKLSIALAATKLSVCSMLLPLWRMEWQLDSHFKALKKPSHKLIGGMTADFGWGINLDDSPFLHEGHSVCQRKGLRKIMANIKCRGSNFHVKVL
jgi:hypothetical protein